MNAEDIVKTDEEQAVAAWINYLNQVRIDALLSQLEKNDAELQTVLVKQRSNFAEALKEIDWANAEVENLFHTNRGGMKGMHGFIAEAAEIGVSNAREQIVGKKGTSTWPNDNGPDDIYRAGLKIQQKFVQRGFSLYAVEGHLKHYPEYVKAGHKYQIPRDYYETVRKLYEMPEDVAKKQLTKSGDGPTLAQWKSVHGFFDRTGLDINKLEPSKLAYDEVQQGTIEDTLDNERASLRETSTQRELKAKADKRQRDTLAYEQSKPSIQEGAAATVAAAVVEGATTFVVQVVKKRRSGKALKEFDADDWAEIMRATGGGTVKGGIRGVSIYVLSNYTATPAAVASSIVTASIGIADQAHLLRSGAISETEFIENSEMLCLDTAVSALSSFVGQALIPIPVVGAVIGNSVGVMMYQIAKDSLSTREVELIAAYAEAQAKLDVELSAQYQQLIDVLNEDMRDYIELLSRAFSPDVAEAFDGSIALAKELGVPSDEILDSREKIQSFFLD